MPEWNDFGKLFVQGLVSAIIALIYFIPVIIIAAIAAAPLIGVIISAATTGADPTTALGGALAGAGIMILIAILVLILAIFLLPMAMIFYAKGGFGDAFKLGSIIKKCLTGNYIISWIIVMAVSVILSVILLIIPFIGTAIASFYLGIVEYSVFAQVYTENTGK